MLNGVVIGNQMVTINTNIWRDDFLRTENLRFHESIRFYDVKSVEISSILIAPFFLLFVLTLRNRCLDPNLKYA